MAIYSGFSHWKWWFSIVFCMFTRGYILGNLHLLGTHLLIKPRVHNPNWSWGDSHLYNTPFFRPPKWMVLQLPNSPSQISPNLKCCPFVWNLFWNHLAHNHQALLPGGSSQLRPLPRKIPWFSGQAANGSRDQRAFSLDAQQWDIDDMDVGQNGRPRGPQMLV